MKVTQVTDQHTSLVPHADSRPEADILVLLPKHKETLASGFNNQRVEGQASGRTKGQHCFDTSS